MGGADQPLGIYLHIPFCARKCNYCDFYSLPGAADALGDAYTDAVCRFIAAMPGAGAPVDTIYFGGGTPTVLGAGRLVRMLQAVYDHFTVDPGAQITLEANPTARLYESLCTLRRAGFNRLSMGAQSFDGHCLALLGRQHTPDQIAQAVADAQRAGFCDISLDLMLAIPGQDAAILEDSIYRCCTLPVTHISAYLLKVEAGTPFDRPDIYAMLPDDEAQSQLYRMTVDRLGRHGFLQYEISNFAKPGYPSRHNLKYWTCQPYLGVGPSAHSFYNGRRFYLPRDLTAFLQQADCPQQLWVDDGAGGDFSEHLMLGLRLNRGVNLPELAARFAVPLQTLTARIAPMQQHGLVTYHDGRLQLTVDGMLVSNAILANLLA